jgi:hypothetical protein
VQHISIFPISAQISTKSETLFGVVAAGQKVSSVLAQTFYTSRTLTRSAVKVCNTKHIDIAAQCGAFGTRADVNLAGVFHHAWSCNGIDRKAQEENN